jgi:hypothetical protein
LLDETVCRGCGRTDAVVLQLNPLRQKTDFVCAINPITPVQISAEKYFAWRVGQITSILSHIPPHRRGAFRDRHDT